MHWIGAGKHTIMIGQAMHKLVYQVGSYTESLNVQGVSMSCDSIFATSLLSSCKVIFHF